jgi:hypothetical protein
MHKSRMGGILERRGGEERREKGMGEGTEVYDAEMLALLRSMEAAIEYLAEKNCAESHHILFGDNTHSVSSTTAAKPGSSQYISKVLGHGINLPRRQHNS